VTLCFILITWLAIGEPIRSWYADRQELLEERHALLTHMRSLASSLPALRSAATPEESTDSATIMLLGATDSIAAADLQERLQKMAATIGVSLTAVETLPPEQATRRFRKVALRISLTTSWPILTELIRAIEQSPTRIFIDDVHFHSPVVLAHSTALPIQASMVVYGFRPIENGA
jgi:general secretion pathway protein M